MIETLIKQTLLICPQDRSNAFKNVMFSEGASVGTALGQGAEIGAARRSGTHSLILLQVLRTEGAGTLFLAQVPFTRHALFAGVARLGAPVNHPQVFYSSRTSSSECSDRNIGKRVKPL